MKSRSLKLSSLLLALFLAAVLAGRAQEGKPAGPACQDNGRCERARYCQKTKCQGPGRCVDRPQACPLVFDPVCGCNGATYSNGCFAAMAGINVRSAGACGIGCTKNSDCKGKNQYCATASGRCGGQGLCTPKSEDCIDVLDPVCGCNGKTYRNFCHAARAGVNVSAPGECGRKGAPKP